MDDDFEPTASIEPIPADGAAADPAHTGPLDVGSTPNSAPTTGGRAWVDGPEWVDGRVTGDHIPPIPEIEGSAQGDHLGLTRLQAPPMQPEPYRGTAFWRRIVAVLGLGAASIAGGLVIAALMGAILVGAAVLLESIIS